MRKKTFLTAGFISVLFLGAIVEACFVNFAQANPIIPKRISTPIGTNPPTMSIFSLQNNSAYASDNVPLVFNASITESKYTNVITYVYYKVDWQEGEIYVYSQNYSDPIKDFSCNKLLVGIPEGTHTMSIHVHAAGGYYEGGYYCYFDNLGSSLVNFIVDSTPPVISVSAMANKTYEVSDVPLNFTVNEPVSQITYCLDKQDNVAVAGNTTLVDLPNGVHNVIVYATDFAGHTSASETIYFTIEVPEPFPTIVVAASIPSVAIIGASLVLYFAKIKKPSKKTK